MMNAGNAWRSEIKSEVVTELYVEIGAVGVLESRHTKVRRWLNPLWKRQDATRQ